MKPNAYLEVLTQAVNVNYGIRLRVLNGRDVSAIRRRIYRARNRARARGDRSFDLLATVIKFPVIDGRRAVELWIVRKDRIGRCDAMEDGMNAETSELAASDLSPRLLGRGFRR